MDILDLDNREPPKQVRLNGQLYDLIPADELTPENIIEMQKLEAVIKSSTDPKEVIDNSNKLLALLLPGAPVEGLSVKSRQKIINFSMGMPLVETLTTGNSSPDSKDSTAGPRKIG